MTQLANLLMYFDTAPAIRLLQSKNAPFVIDFLKRQFKDSARIAIPHSELLAALVSYKEQVSESYPDRLIDSADHYLSHWCSAETQSLRRFLSVDSNEPLYQLTPSTEDVLTFLDGVLGKAVGFVGTESRLKLVIDTLDDIVVRSSDDPGTRLAHLKEARERLQDEISRIEIGGNVAKYQPAQIRERFATAVSLLRQLQGDFRAVEESFREITAQVQQRQAEGRDSRGGILEFALDSEDVLKKDDQGVSFYAFVKLILSPTQMERLERTIREVRRIPELTAQQEGLETIRDMVTLLQNEADKVMRTNQRLSATLRRMLDQNAQEERQQLGRILRDIRLLALRVAEQPPLSVGVLVEVDSEADTPFRRTFWNKPPQFESVDLRDYAPDEAARLEAFRRLAAMHRLDWREMRSRIMKQVSASGSLTLRELVDVYPAKGGIIELLAYLQIARDDNHLVSNVSSETIVVGNHFVTVPLVTFTSPAVETVVHAR